MIIVCLFSVNNIRNIEVPKWENIALTCDKYNIDVVILLFVESDVLLVGELRHLLSNMFTPLTVASSEVLEPSTLNKITGEN